MKIGPELTCASTWLRSPLDNAQDLKLGEVYASYLNDSATAATLSLLTRLLIH